MRLKVEPVTIPVALFQSQLVRLKEVSSISISHFHPKRGSRLGRYGVCSSRPSTI
jgi:hypothetical protein